MLTVVMPSFHSSALVEDRILEIGEDIPIIIIENSKDIKFKRKAEEKFKNVNIIIPDENLGWGKAINLGIKKSSTDFVFITQPDVMLIDRCIEKLIECTKNFQDFTVLTPIDTNDQIFKNYETKNIYKSNIIDNKFLLQEVDYVDLTWLINKNNFGDADLWDENIFLYFEAKDFSKRIKENKKKIFIAKGIRTFHIGSSSHDKRLEYFSKLNRNWHYNWSRYYFNKKHFGKFYALKKAIILLFKLVSKYLRAVLFFKNKDRKLIYAELHGLICSVLNKSSYYRPYKNIHLQ